MLVLEGEGVKKSALALWGKLVGVGFRVEEDVEEGGVVVMEGVDEGCFVVGADFFDVCSFVEEGLGGVEVVVLDGEPEGVLDVVDFWEEGFEGGVEVVFEGDLDGALAFAVGLLWIGSFCDEGGDDLVRLLEGKVPVFVLLENGGEGWFVVDGGGGASSFF